jgi:hypothetical protein
MSILLCQPIFGPIDRVTERNVNSLNSLGKYLKENNVTNVDVCLGGWARDAIQWGKIKEAIKNNFGKIEILSFRDNVGKAIVINNLTKKFLKPHHKYIMSADSDILFDTEVPDLFNRLIEMSHISEQIKQRPFGLLGLQQKGQGCEHPRQLGCVRQIAFVECPQPNLS